jgi:hypothetical protein
LCRRKRQQILLLIVVPLEAQSMIVAVEKPAFQIGIAMAGAGSGGAYAAGVFDFLMEALYEWQKAKDRGEAVPRHDVFIATLSGTSAGGITAALGLMSLAGGIRPVEGRAVNQQGADPDRPRTIRRVLPELYDLWVQKLRLFGTRDATARHPMDGNESLLDTGDINSGRVPDSLLNSNSLTRMGREAVSRVRPTGRRYAFFTEPTHLFLTRANLDGTPRPVEFGQSGYIIAQYEGRAHFAIQGLGGRAFPGDTSQWLERCGDLGDPVKVDQLAKMAGRPANEALVPPFEALTQATLATCAIPIIFKARQIETSMRPEQFSLAFAATFSSMLDQDDKDRLRGIQGGPLSPIESAGSVCVDGGTLNNEPFELVRWSIRDLDKDMNSREPDKADRAVILIAPFPPKWSSADLPAEGRDLSLGTVGRMLLGALLYHARYKATDLVAATDPNVYSRYLISPKRDGKEPALATAALGSAGGFFDEKFREHDFQLGRLNCQQFLSKEFVLKSTNPVFGVEAKVGAGPDDFRPIIPLRGSARSPIELPPWPTMSRASLAELRAALENRLYKFVAAALAAKFLDSYGGVRIVARLWWWWRSESIVDRVMGQIEQALEKSGQLEAGSSATSTFTTSTFTSGNTDKQPWFLWFAALLMLALLAILFLVPF